MGVYLDFNATTPVDSRVYEAMRPYFREEFGNPNSAHGWGSVARKAVERARMQVGELLGADPGCLTFTASATEAINTAVWSTVARRNSHRSRIVVSAVEHAAVLEASRAAGRFGIEVTTVPVAQSGALDLDALRHAIGDDVLLVSVMWANNETGVVFPVEEVADICEERGAALLVDAVQAAGKLDVDLRRVPITYLAVSSHKLFGPKGAAALIAPSRSVAPLIIGGGQEGGRRSGTENVPAIVGFGCAAELASREMQSRCKVAGTLRDVFEQYLLTHKEACAINGFRQPRLANTSSVTFFGMDADALIGVLDAEGVAISSGSACHARTVGPSHVILAMTGSHQSAMETVRVSFSHLNTQADVDLLIMALTQARLSLRPSPH